MTDKNLIDLTNEDIISSLEVIATTCNCNECKIRNCKWGTCNCEQITANAALDLIKRQQAEIERLEKLLNGRDQLINALNKCYKQAKSEAVKEFVDRLKEVSSEMVMMRDNGTPISISYSISSKKLDNILKEMVGDKK